MEIGGVKYGYKKRNQKMLIEKDKTIKEIAELLDISRQGLNKKFNKETIYFSEVEKVLDHLGYEITIIKKGEG